MPKKNKAELVESDVLHGVEDWEYPLDDGSRRQLRRYRGKKSTKDNARIGQGRDEACLGVASSDVTSGSAVDEVVVSSPVQGSLGTELELASGVKEAISMDISESGNDGIEMAGPGEPGPDSDMSENGVSAASAGSNDDHKVAVHSSDAAEFGTFQVHGPPAQRAGVHNVLSASQLHDWGTLHSLSDEAMAVLKTCGPGVVGDVKTLLTDEIARLDLGKNVTEELLAASKCLDEPCPHEIENDAQNIPYSKPSGIEDDFSGAPVIPSLDLGLSDSESDSEPASVSESSHMITEWGNLHKLDSEVLELFKRLGYATLDKLADLTEQDLVKMGLAYDQVKEVLGAIQCLRINGPCPHVESETTGVEIASDWDARFGMSGGAGLKTSDTPATFGTDFDAPLDIHLDAWATLHNLNKSLLSVLQRLGYGDLKSVSKITQQDLDRLGISEEQGEALLEAVGCLQNEGPCPHITATVIRKSMIFDEEVKKNRPRSRYGKGHTEPTWEDTEKEDAGAPEDNLITFTTEGDATVLTRRLEELSEEQRQEMIETSKTQFEEFAQTQILEVLHGLAKKPGELHKAPEVATKDAVLAKEESEPDLFVRSISRMLDRSEAAMKPEGAGSTPPEEGLQPQQTAVNMNPLLLHNLSLTKESDPLERPSVPSPTSPGIPRPKAGRGRSRGETPPDSRMTDVDNSEEDFDTGPPDHVESMNMMAAMAPPGQGPARPAALAGGLKQVGPGHKMKPPQFADDDDDDDEDGSDTDDDDEDDDDDDDDDDDEGGVALEGAYDPADYDHLPVVPEIKELFQYITRYTPQAIELEHKLKPFIPDFIPAVGDIDAFIKITRPDNKPDDIGLKVLDEPCAKQSDPTVLDLHLRSISKQTNLKAVSIKSVENAEKNPKAIDSWIESISELHRSKPPPNVHYTKNMPDIETLMQEWPPEFEDLLKEVGLPTAEIDCDLGTYVDMICAILDIPVHKSKIQSLHVLFTLYSEFKNSQHFKSLAEGNQLDNNMKEMNFMDAGEDRLIL